jgi:hypothetical protein
VQEGELNFFDFPAIYGPVTLGMLACPASGF